MRLQRLHTNFGVILTSMYLHFVKSFYDLREHPHHKACEMFVYKHTETIEYVKK